MIEQDNTFRPEKMSSHKEHHRSIIWMYFVNVFLGLWLIAGSAFLFSEGHTLFALNDCICGSLICLFSFLSLSPARIWAPWVVAFTGLWLNVAPILFWAPELAIYQNNILVGIFVIAFSVIAPGQPGSRLYEEDGPDIPPSWSVNPSSWGQRIPIITLGWIGFFASSYLAAYQLGYIDTVWDPVFGKGTTDVLDSDVSKAWPVSDAGLGAFSYMLDAMMGYLGGQNRWRTMPWAVIFFGILIVPLGAVSITLIILQPLAVGAWCFICLLTATAMLIMIPCTVDEVIASVDFLVRSKKEGKPIWKTFWRGGTLQGEPSNMSPAPGTNDIFGSIFSGFAIPWNLLLICFTGIWLMMTPFLFGYGDALADSDHVSGALVITFAVIAMGEISRSARFINIVLGVWILAAPFILGHTSMTTRSNAIICGLMIIFLSFRKGKIQNQYGSFDKYIV